MSNLETLMIVFIIVTAVAVVVQMGVLLALYANVKKSSSRMESLANQLESRAVPTLEMAQNMLQEYRPKVDTILQNLAETSTTVKQEIARLDASLSDVVDRTRLQVIRVDELFSRTLDRVEEATELVHHSVLSPVRQATGVLHGITMGLATLLNKGPHARAKHSAGVPKEDMFI
jgi:hypothetical protein